MFNKIWPVTHRFVGGDHLLEDLWGRALGLQVGVLVTEVKHQQGVAVGAHEPRAEGQDALLQVGHRWQAAQLLEGHDGILRVEVDGGGERGREKTIGRDQEWREIQAGGAISDAGDVKTRLGEFIILNIYTQI